VNRFCNPEQPDTLPFHLLVGEIISPDYEIGHHGTVPRLELRLKDPGMTLSPLSSNQDGPKLCPQHSVCITALPYRTTYGASRDDRHSPHPDQTITLGTPPHPPPKTCFGSYADMYFCTVTPQQLSCACTFTWNLSISRQVTDLLPPQRPFTLVCYFLVSEALPRQECCHDASLAFLASFSPCVFSPFTCPPPAPVQTGKNSQGYAPLLLVFPCPENYRGKESLNSLGGFHGSPN